MLVARLGAELRYCIPNASKCGTSITVHRTGRKKNISEKERHGVVIKTVFIKSIFV